MLICQMADNHLMNVINLYAKRLKISRTIISDDVKNDPMIEALNPSFSLHALKEKAVQEIKLNHDKIQPYIIEAVLRGLAVTPILQDAYGRSTAVPNLKLNISAMLEIEGEFIEDESEFRDIGGYR